MKSKLWERRGDKLFIRDTEDYLIIKSSNNLYPEEVVCESADGVRLKFQQASPNLYVFVEKL